MDAEPGITRIEPQDGLVWAVSWSPDGGRIASGGSDGTARIWDAGTGKEVQRLDGHTEMVNSVAWSPRGRAIATAGSDGTIRIWVADTGEQERRLDGHRGPVLSVAWSPDERRVATSSSDRSVRVWDVGTGAQMLQIDVVGDAVHDVAWSPDGRHLVASGGDTTARVWAADTGAETVALGDGGAAYSVAWSPDGTRIATGDGLGSIRIWSAAAGAQLRELEGHKYAVFSLAWSPDGATLVSGGEDGSVRVWDPDTGDRVLARRDEWVVGVAWSADANLVAGARGGSVLLWDVETGKETRRLDGHTSPVNAVAWSPDGRSLATASDDGSACIWQPDTGERLRQLEKVNDFMRSVAWSPDGRAIASASSEVRVWDAETGERIGEFDGRRTVNAVAWSPDGGAVASAGGDGITKIWSLRTGEEIRSPFAEHAGAVNAVAWSPDGTEVATAGDDGTVRIWNARTDDQVHRTLSGHTGSVNAVAWSSDGAAVATAGSDGTARIWDHRSGQQTRQLDRHTGRVSAVAWSSGDRLLVTASSDRTARIWNLDADGEHVAFDLASSCLDCAPHPQDDRWLATGVRSGARIWHTSAVPVAKPDTAPPSGVVTGDAPLIHDAPTSRDELGRRAMAIDLGERLVELTSNGDETAFAVHLDGRWGEGKSSFVRFLADHLSDDASAPKGEKWTVVEVDTWRSSQMSPAWWALLTHLRRGVWRSSSRRGRIAFFFGMMWRSIRRQYRYWTPVVLVLLLTCVFWMVDADVLAWLAGVSSVVTLAGLVGAHIAGVLGLGSLQGARLHEKTNDNPMVEVAAQFDWIRRRSRQPILLVLDDLDRCNETFAVQLLDAVQTLLRTPTSDLDRRSKGRKPASLVVLAVGDQRWLRAAYEHAYRVFSPFVVEPGRPLGHQFLNKLFQVRIELPRIPRDQYTGYIDVLLGNDRQPVAEDERVEEIKRRIDDVFSDTAARSADAAIVDELDAGKHLSSGGQQAIARAAIERRRTDPERNAREANLLREYSVLLDANPRSGKRFLMAYNVAFVARSAETAAGAGTFDPRALALWTVVTIRWPELAEWMKACVEADVPFTGHDDADGARYVALMKRADVSAVLDAAEPLGGPIDHDKLVRLCGLSVAAGERANERSS